MNSAYKSRSIRFIEIHQHNQWHLKIYSISYNNEPIRVELILNAKSYLSSWLQQSNITQLPTYFVGTLILHQGKDNNFAVINWWVDENMLQQYVYILNNQNEFEIFSNIGIITCVWELAVLWHERNAWVKHILMKHESPDINAFLNDQLNENI